MTVINGKTNAERVAEIRAQRAANPKPRTWKFPWPPVAAAPSGPLPCVHRGDVVGSEACRTCSGRVELKIHDCRLHETCSLSTRSREHRHCADCADHQEAPSLVDFARLNNGFSGRTCWIIGSGRTDFDYAALGETDDPVMFINMAAHAEQYVRHSDTFFFSQDRKQHVYLPRIRSVGMIPVGSPLAEDREAPSLKRAWRICFLRHAPNDDRSLLGQPREVMAVEKRLYRGPKRHVTTATYALHFAWYAGFDKVFLVGCDGIPHAGYDPRLANRTGQRYEDKWKYERMKRNQDMVIESLGLNVEYVGRPKEFSDGI